jgi:hypothetical protein
VLIAPSRSFVSSRSFAPFVSSCLRVRGNRRLRTFVVGIGAHHESFPSLAVVVFIRTGKYFPA